MPFLLQQRILRRSAYYYDVAATLKLPLRQSSWWPPHSRRQGGVLLLCVPSTAKVTTIGVQWWIQLVVIGELTDIKEKNKNGVVRAVVVVGGSEPRMTLPAVCV